MTADLQTARRGPALLPAVEAAGETGDLYTLEDLTPGSLPRLFVLGYMDAAQFDESAEATVDEQVSTARAQLIQYANEHQLTLGNIYVDGAGGSQFRVLLIAIGRCNPQLVLVPGLDHVGLVAGAGRATRTRLEQIDLRTTATVRAVNPMTTS